MMRIAILTALLFLLARAPAAEAPITPEGFALPQPGRRFVFPRDHGSHRVIDCSTELQRSAIVHHLGPVLLRALTHTSDGFKSVAMRALYNCLLLSPLTQKYFSQEHNAAFQSPSSSSSSCSIPHIIISLLSFRIGPPERHLAAQCAPFWGIGTNDQLQMAAACLKLLCCCAGVARAMVAAGDFPAQSESTIAWLWG